MLIEVPYKNGDVVTVKMKSGEELVGKLEASDDISIKIAKPLTLVASQQGIGLQPFLFTADINKSYVIKWEAITLVAPTKKEFADTYPFKWISIGPQDWLTLLRSRLPFCLYARFIKQQYNYI